MAREKIILDVDTGSDDAVAIICAALSEQIELHSVCTVWGNRPLEQTTENTLRVLDMLGMGDRIKVYPGCATSMVASLLKNRHAGYDGQRKSVNGGEEKRIHQETIDELPPSHTKAQNKRAVMHYVETIMNGEDGEFTLVPVGPLTNVAMALRVEPQIAKKIKQIVLMGGGCRRTNSTAAAEFNIWADPEAAQIVFNCGAKITVVPLDATHNACINSDEVEALYRIGTPAANCVADMVKHRIEAYSYLQPMARRDSAPVHDALAVCYLIDPAVLEQVELVRCDVDISGGIADGQTIIDPRTYTDLPPNVYFAFYANRDRFSELLFEILKKAAA